jgi:Icc-related predicted phosphoesterase
MPRGCASLERTEGLEARLAKTMRILVISDLHGNLRSAWEAIERFKPDVLFSCGDWGDPDQVTEAELSEVTERLPVLTTFGNHDPLEILKRLRNRDGSRVLMEQGEVRVVEGVRVAAIGGIWAKSHRLPHYVTDADVAEAAAKAARDGPVDVLLTHGCPIGLADMTPSGKPGGQRCFLDAFHAISPRVHFCGHLHVAQERTLKDGRRVINVGETPAGSVAIADVSEAGIDARLERFGKRSVAGAERQD